MLCDAVCSEIQELKKVTPYLKNVKLTFHNKIDHFKPKSLFIINFILVILVIIEVKLIKFCQLAKIKLKVKIFLYYFIVF